MADRIATCVSSNQESHPLHRRHSREAGRGCAPERPAAYAGWEPHLSGDGASIGRTRGAGWAYGVRPELGPFGGHRGDRGVISVRRVSLGGGYRYLTSSVAAGDGAAGHSNDLARYYASSGTPPGVRIHAMLVRA